MSERIDEFKGAVKETAGKVTDNERLEAEGKGEQAAAKASRETKGAANQAMGNVKDAVGDATDNERLEAEGEAQKAKGQAQSAG
jgi:uncharacterized protein YjbJ (UPF0337 family)